MGHPVVHFEIPANDLEKMEHFYNGLFGWKMNMQSNMPEYVMVEAKTDGEGINGGLMKKHMAEQRPVNYVMVESVSEYAKKAGDLGGQLVVPKTAISKMGYFAVALDPEGNPIGMFEMDESAA